MRVIWDVCSVMLFHPFFGAYLWESIKLYLVCGGTGAGNFPQLFMPFVTFRPIKPAFENFGFPLVVKKAWSCCYVSWVESVPRLESVWPTACLESRERFLRRSALQVDHHEWHGMWEKMGQFWGKFSASTVWSSPLNNYRILIKQQYIFKEDGWCDISRGEEIIAVCWALAILYQT